MNYIMHFGIKGMKWRKRKTLAQQAESQARVAEGRRRAYDEARYAQQKANADLDREVDKHIRAAKAAKDQTKKRVYRALEQQDLASKNASYTRKKALEQPQPDRKALVEYRHKVEKNIKKYNSKGAKKLRKLFGKKPTGKLVTKNKAVYRVDKNQRMEYTTSKWVPKKKR